MSQIQDILVLGNQGLSKADIIIVIILSMTKKYLIITFLLILPFSLYSKNEIDLSLKYFKKTKDNKGIVLSHKYEKSKFITKTDIKYFKEGKNTSINEGSLSINYDQKLKEKYYIWYFNKNSYDKIKNIEFETLMGGGLKYLIINSQDILFDISNGLLYNKTAYRNFKDKEQIRNSLRIKLKLIKEKLYEASFITFYQPDVSSFKDYIINSTFYLNYFLTDKISIKFKIEDTYRSYTYTNYYNDLYIDLLLSFRF